ncbi:dihydrofolate reductase family protein [Mucilaginibacter sp. AW1-3]
MRKLVFAINTTLDGYCDHTLFFPDDELMEYFTQLARDADTYLYGRKTYELMVPYWPDLAKNPDNTRKLDVEFARAFDAVSKIVVFSKTLDGVANSKTKIVHTGLRDEILRLKQEEGKDISTGGVNLASQLAELGLIDEYHFVVLPIIAGGGTKVFNGINLQEQLNLKLIDSRIFKSGAVALRYIS